MPSADALVSQRNPTPADDSTKGYAVGNFWNNTSNGTIWTSSSVSSGHAVWTQVTLTTAPIVDQVGATAEGAYGVIKLAAAYAGASFQVQRSSDNTTQDIGFVNGVADWATADTFCSGSNQCYVTKFYDQIGSCDAVQATNANAPVVDNFTTYGYLRGLTLNNYNAGALSSAIYLACSTFAGFASNNFSAFVLAAPESSATFAGYFTIGTSGTANIAVINNKPFLKGFGNGGFASGVAVQHWVSSFPMPTVIEAHSSASLGEIVGANDVADTAAASGTSTVYTGLYLGVNSALGSVALTGKLYAAVFYSTALTSTQRTTFKAAAYQQLGIIPQVRDNLVSVGDSITAGYRASSNYPTVQAVTTNYGTIALQSMKKLYRYYNLSVPGISAVTQASTIGTWLPAAIQSGATNVCFEYLGTNDMQQGQTGAQLYTNIGTITGQMQTSGCAGIFAGNLFQSNVGDWAAFNTLMGTLPTGTTALINFAADATIGCSSCNVAPYFSDGIHPTPLGHTFMATDLLTPLIAAGYAHQ